MTTFMTRRRSLAAVTFGAALLAMPLALDPAGAAAAKPKSCTRGGATLEAAAGNTRVVRVEVKRSSGESRHEKLLACWVKTGRRVTVSEEVDRGLDNIARTRVEIVQGRYVGVLETNEGGISSGAAARVYDARTAKILHHGGQCDQVDQGDFGGVDDVVFLEDGGMAFSCRQLLLYRKGASKLEVLEPLGTEIAQIGASQDTRNFGQRLFWTVVAGGQLQAKSLAL